MFKGYSYHSNIYDSNIYEYMASQYMALKNIYDFNIYATPLGLALIIGNRPGLTKIGLVPVIL